MAARAVLDREIVAIAECAFGEGASRGAIADALGISRVSCVPEIQPSDSLVRGGC